MLRNDDSSSCFREESRNHSLVLIQGRFSPKSRQGRNRVALLVKLSSSNSEGSGVDNTATLS